jgi:predicted PurR-regulated permease PerM
MTGSDEQRAGSALFGPLTVEAVVRLGLLALLAYWALQVVGPFLTIGLWSAILAVALYPVFDWLARLLGRPRTAATLLTLLCVLIVLGPVTWLGLSLINGAEFLVGGIRAKTLAIPLPADSVKSWPLVGERLYHVWMLAATDTKAMLAQVLPRLQPVGAKLLNVAGAVGVGLLEFIASIVIAGFLFVPGPRLARSLRASLRRVFGPRSGEMMQIAGATIRNVSRGVVGVSLLQSLLAGVGFLVAGIPAAGFLTLGVLVLGIIQIGSGPVLLPVVAWSWFKLKTTTALLLTIYLVPVGLIDNVLKPIVMAHGLAAPMAIILVGVIGGTLVFGVSGLFLGPIVLSVAWALIAAWVQQAVKDAENSEAARPE